MTDTSVSYSSDSSDESGSDDFVFYQSAPFDALPPAAIDQLKGSVVYKAFEAGDTVFSIGQYGGDDIVFVERGTARVTTSAEDGALSVTDFHVGELIGVELVLTQRQEAGLKIGLSAMTPLRLAYIDAALFEDLVQRYPTFARGLLRWVAQRLVAQDIEPEVGISSPSQRIFAYLFDLIERKPDDLSSWHIPVMPRHREVSDATGTSELDAAEAVADLIGRGIAKRDYPGMVIVDYDSFHALAR